MDGPIQTTDDTFDREVLAAQRPVVLDFWAEWCPPCHTVTGWMQRLAGEMGDRVVVAQADVEACPQLVATYAVQGVPTILLLRDGQIVHRQREELTESDLRGLVEQHLLGNLP